MRKSSKFIVVAGALAALAAPSVASANVAVDNGVGHVDKGDVQTALKWNNSDFDRGTVTFTAGVTKTYDNVLTCGANADNKVVHVISTASGDGTVNKTDVLSSNGKQVTGWTLTGVNSSAVAVSNDLWAVTQATFTACLPDKPYTEMTPEELRRLPVKVVTPTTPTVTFGGLKVNGVDLPNTPVV